ncbi:MAG: acetyl-CoA carboxylase, carboxyltransferase subunit beta [Candidatus Latescibacterota bacterium]
MNWFDRMKSGFNTHRKKELPDGVWIKCDGCATTLYRKELEHSQWVCHHCGHHFRIPYTHYLRILLDEGTALEVGAGITSADPLRFRAVKRYTEKIKDSRKLTGMNDAIWTGTGVMGGHPVALGVMDFRFIGASMGSAVGEKIARLVVRAMENRLPVIIIATSGGARMQEGALSLMQMAKTSMMLGQLSDAGLPFISVMTDPTTGGVTASFAMLGDILLAEPKALIGFAGPRIIKETLQREELPEGFQRSESVLANGFLDRIVDRREMKATLSQFVGLLMGAKAG